MIALPANHARTATAAIVAAVQRADFEPAAEGAAARGDAVVLPEGLPHRWQKRAPLASGALQPAQVAAWSDVPQLAQNRPVAVAEQLGHTVPAESDSVMAYNLTWMKA